MSLFGKRTKINDSSAEKAQDTKAVVKKAPAKKAVAKAPKVDKKAEKKAESVGEKRAAAAAGIVFPKGSAVIRPRITEKSGLLSQKGIYTFDVLVDVNSKQIAQAITEAYKVVPVKINLSSIKSKTMFARGKSGKTASGKKAYVYLKKGDVIEFI